MRAGRGDRGAVTVEAALALVALIAVLAFGLAGVAAAADQVRCTDAAREAARVAARGEPERIADVVARIAPPGARWGLRSDAEGITVAVRADPAGGLLPWLTIRAEAFAVPEPGVGRASDDDVAGSTR